ncbi:MAG: site-specific DNA-methyltransferase [Cyclobacteriaceae bacterium]
MIKDSIQQNENTTPNSKQLAVLKEHFPACFKVDGSFDVERFKAEIAATANVVNEGYELKFLGKSYAKLLASTETTTVIQPNEAHNNLPENAKSENIYISGDNLDGLKHLLKSYSGAIKCIYIDPPYNTGSDGFVYADNFNYTKENLQEKLSVSEEEADRILDLTKRGSASHSAWLMFMYSRLLLAKDLLKDDGVIFISIDDNEQSNLKLLCDDVFGEENFAGQITLVNNPRGRDYGGIARMHEYLICYRRTFLAEINDLFEKDKVFPFNDEVSGFELRELRNRNIAFNKENRPNLYYPFYINTQKKLDNDLLEITLTKTEGYEELYPKESQGVDTVWRWGKDKALENLNTNIAAKEMEDGGYMIVEKYRKKTKMARSVWNGKEDNSEKGTLLLKQLFDGKKLFDFPKSVEMLQKLIEMGSNSESDILLDFFSGSGSFANAVFEQNAKDGINRQFLACQINVPLDENSKSNVTKNAYKYLEEQGLPTTLDYIGIERIKRAASKIKEAYPDKQLDLGFKHYILYEPNQNTLDKLDSFDKAALLADTTIMEEFGKPTILTTWLNADGYGLTVQAEAIDLAGYTAYYCQKHLYLIDPGFTLESMKALLSKYDAEGHFNPENMVLFGYSFPDWSINEMIEKNLRILNDGEKNLKINFTVRY